MSRGNVGSGLLHRTCTCRASGVPGGYQPCVTVNVSPRASLMAQQVKNPPAMQETQKMQVRSWVRKIAWRRAWQPAPVFLPGESHGQRSLAGYSSYGHEEPDMTERLALSLIPAHPLAALRNMWKSEPSPSDGQMVLSLGWAPQLCAPRSPHLPVGCGWRLERGGFADHTSPLCLSSLSP